MATLLDNNLIEVPEALVRQLGWKPGDRVTVTRDDRGLRVDLLIQPSRPATTRLADVAKSFVPLPLPDGLSSMDLLRADREGQE